MSHASNTELEKRLRALTDTVIEKQTTIEALSSDKSALALELERTRMHSVIKLAKNPELKLVFQESWTDIISSCAKTRTR